MRDTDFAYAVARIRSNENKLLTQQDIEGLLLCDSYASCVARLADKGWTASEADGDAIVSAERDRLWALIDEILPDSPVFNSLKLPNDYHNLKAALKARIMRLDWSKHQLRPATVAADVITEAVEKKQFNLLPPRMAAAAAEAYDVLVSGGDGQLCDMIVDAASLTAAIEAAKPYGGVLLEFAELEAYRANVRIAVRCARMKKSLGIIRSALAECSSVDVDRLAAAAAQEESAVCELLSQTDREAADALRDSLAAFERLCSARMNDRLEYTKYVSLGAEPIVAYIHCREKEMRQVRIILAGLRNQVSVERIRELL